MDDFKPSENQANFFTISYPEPSQNKGQGTGLTSSWMSWGFTFNLSVVAFSRRMVT